MTMVIPRAQITVCFAPDVLAVQYPVALLV